MQSAMEKKGWREPNVHSTFSTDKLSLFVRLLELFSSWRTGG
jgi:hypothetical protein